jgi:Spy/CpxP family protein refolding chaperone
MKYLLLLTGLAFAGMANAQPEMDNSEKKSPEEMAAAMTKKMTKSLSLTPEQVAKIEPQNVLFFQQQAAHQEQIRALRNQQKAQADLHKNNIKAVLTPEQQVKAEKLMAERQEKREKRIKKRMK